MTSPEAMIRRAYAPLWRPLILFVLVGAPLVACALRAPSPQADVDRYLGWVEARGARDTRPPVPAGFDAFDLAYERARSTRRPEDYARAEAELRAACRGRRIFEPGVRVAR